MTKCPRRQAAVDRASAMPSRKAEFLGIHSTWLDLLGDVVNFFRRIGEGDDAFGEGHVARLLGEDGHRGDFDQRPGPRPELDSHQTKGQYRHHGSRSIVAA